MMGFGEWLLCKLRLIDEDEDIETYEERKQENEVKLKYDRHIFYKNIMSYTDVKDVLDKYRLGAVCVIRTNPTVNSDAQGMLNYICGGAYTLDGRVEEVGLNVFAVTHK